MKETLARPLAHWDICTCTRVFFRKPPFFGPRPCILGLYLCMCALLDDGCGSQKSSILFAYFLQKEKAKSSKIYTQKCNPLATGQKPSGRCLVHEWKEQDPTEWCTGRSWWPPPSGCDRSDITKWRMVRG